MGQWVNDLDTALETLKALDLVVFSAQGEAIGAYPFTMEPREHRVKVNGHRLHAMCALDALSIAPMFGLDTELTSVCRVTGDPIRIRQSAMKLDGATLSSDAQIGIAWAAASSDSCCANNLCMEMIFLRDADIAAQWLAEAPDSRECFTLPQAVEFGARFFSPLLS